MENVGTRIKAFRISRDLTQKDVFRSTHGEIKQTTLSAIETGQAKPGFDTLAALAKAYPELNSDWLLTGVGPMLRDGRALTPTVPSDEPPPTPAAPASGLPFTGEVLDKLLHQINRQAQQHREELALLKKEHRAALTAEARRGQYNMDAMTEKVYFLEGRLGLRPLTAAETQAQAAAEAPRPKKIGLKHYDESAPTARLLMLNCARHGEASALRAA